MATDKEIIENYLLKDQQGKWVLGLKELSILHKMSVVSIYRILKNNNILPRDRKIRRKNKVNIKEALENVERAIKLLKKTIASEIVRDVK